MNQSPFFTIITASYNSQRTIQKTIESLLEQDFTDFEYIIIDGNSKDDTMKIVESFSTQFTAKNIAYTFISEADKGIYDAWNKGVALAKGEWISFLGSDDNYLPGALSLYNKAIVDNPNMNFFCSNIEIIDENRKFLKTYGSPFSKEVLKRKMNFAQVGAFHHKDLFSKIGPFDYSYKIVGDYDFYLRAKEIIQPFFIVEPTVQMMNIGVSNQAYKALTEARNLKNKNGINSQLINNYDLILNLTKINIKKLLNI